MLLPVEDIFEVEVVEEEKVEGLPFGILLLSFSPRPTPLTPPLPPTKPPFDREELFAEWIESWEGC